MAEPHLADLAMVQDQGVIFKHFFIQRAALILQFQLIHLFCIRRQFRQVDQDIIQGCLPREFQEVVLFFICCVREAECRMPADRKVHLLIPCILDFPFYGEAVSFQPVSDCQLKIKGVYFFCLLV